MRLIRYSTDYDASIASLFHDTVQSACRDAYTPAELDAWAPDDIDAASWCEELGRTYTLLAIEDGNLIGFGNADISGNYIDRLYVAPDRIGHGIGKLLLRSLEAKLSGTVHVHASDTSLPFFRHMGYSIVRENHILRCGIVLRNWNMEKEL